MFSPSPAPLLLRHPFAPKQKRSPQNQPEEKWFFPQKKGSSPAAELIESSVATATSALRIFELKNGLRIALEEDHSAKLVAFFARIHAGSISEGSLTGCGLSHLLEHAMFLGSKKFPPKDGFSRLIEQFGGIDLNAYTTYDHTAYFATVFAEKLYPSISAFLSFLFEPLFPLKALKEEMGTIRSEMQMVSDNPSWVFFNHIQETLYQQKPYAAPIIGFLDQFNTLNARHVKNYHKKQYHPKNIVLSLKGALQSDDTIKRIARLLKSTYRELSEVPSQDSPSITSPHEKNFPTMSAHAKGKNKAKTSFKLSAFRPQTITTITHPRAKHVKVAYTWKAPTFAENYDVLLNLLCSFLTGGESTPLVVALKHRLALVHSISAASFSQPRYFKQDHGSWTLQMSLSEKSFSSASLSSTLKKINTALFTTLVDLLASPNSTELERIVAGIKNETLKEFIDEKEHFLEAASSTATAIQSIRSTTFPSWYLNEVRKTSLTSLLATLASGILKTPFSLAILTPENLKLKGSFYGDPILSPSSQISSFNDSPPMLKDALNEYASTPSPFNSVLRPLTSFHSHHQKTHQKLSPKSNAPALAEPKTSKASKASGHRYPLATAKILPNGAHWMQTAHHNLPKIVLVIRIRGGQTLEGPFAQIQQLKTIAPIIKTQATNSIPYGTFALLSRMLFTSSDVFSKRRLHEILKTFAIDYETSCGTSSYTLKLSYLHEHHPTVLKILKSILSRTSLRARDFAKEKADLRFEIKRERESLAKISSLAFNNAFYADTPYAAPLKGTQESIKHISLPLLESLLKVSLSGPNVSASVHGAFRPEEGDELAALIAALPAGKEILAYPKHSFTRIPRLPRSEKFLCAYEPGAQETHLRIGFRGPPLSSRHTLALALIRSHLSGMGGPLFRLRSEDFIYNGKSIGGRAYSLGCRAHSERDFSALIFYAALRYEARNETTFMRQAFLREIAKLRQVPLSESKLQSAKDAFRAAELMSALSWLSQASSETLYQTYQMHPHSGRRRLHKLLSLSAKDLQDTANRFLRDDAFLEHVLTTTPH